MVFAISHLNTVNISHLVTLTETVRHLQEFMQMWFDFMGHLHLKVPQNWIEAISLQMSDQQDLFWSCHFKSPLSVCLEGGAFSWGDWDAASLTSNIYLHINDAKYKSFYSWLLCFHRKTKYLIIEKVILCRNN